MFKNTIFRRMTALVLTLALAAAAALPGLAVYPMPIQTASETEAVYLFNADTGKIILNQNADQQQYVASLTKLVEMAGGINAGICTILAEGDAADRKDIIYLEKLPLFDREGKIL